VPPGSVEQQDGVGSLRDRAGDLVEVKLHRFGVGEREGQGRARAASRTDRAEQVGALVALISGLARSRSALRPLPYDTVLLADPRLILEPDLDGFFPRDVGQMGSQRGRKVFLNASIVRASCVG
jgi:hypothetical protein